MSAAEAARHQTSTGTPAGDVISMAKHRVVRIDRARPARACDEGLTPEQELAVDMEAMFHAHKMTLTDDTTRESYIVTLAIVDLLLRGALAKGTLDEEQHDTLSALISGMRNAPEHL